MKKFYPILIILILHCSCNKEEATVIEPIVLDKSKITIQIDEEAVLNILNINLDTVNVNSIKWFSSDPSVVMVVDGLVKGVSSGESLIYVAVGSMQTPSCKVSVRGIFDEDYDVYIAGSNAGKATYWKNGIAVDLSSNDMNDPNYKSEINALFVTDNDIYATGFEDKFPYGFNATYWKNGVITRLSDKFSYANDIFVSNNNVYVVGNEINEAGNGFIATLWTNETAKSLSGESESSVATSVFVDNNDVYVGGYSFLDGRVIPKYWKNGQLTILPSTDGSWVDDIQLHNGDLYIVGTELGDKPRAKYWKNGNKVFLTNQGVRSFSRSIAFDGDDVYISGYVFVDSLNYYVPTFWKNGIEKRLSETEIIRYDCDVVCSDGNVYFLANESYNSEFQIPKYWKNGIEKCFVEWSDSLNVLDIEIFPK